MKEIDNSQNIQIRLFLRGKCQPLTITIEGTEALTPSPRPLPPFLPIFPIVAVIFVIFVIVIIATSADAAAR